MYDDPTPSVHVMANTIGQLSELLDSDTALEAKVQIMKHSYILLDSGIVLLNAGVLPGISQHKH